MNEASYEVFKRPLESDSPGRSEVRVRRERRRRWTPARQAAHRAGGVGAEYGGQARRRAARDQHGFAVYLAARVSQPLLADPFCGHLFLFRSKRADYPWQPRGRCRPASLRRTRRRSAPGSRRRVAGSGSPPGPVNYLQREFSRFRRRSPGAPDPHGGAIGAAGAICCAPFCCRHSTASDLSASWSNAPSWVVGLRR